jgi:hypothetical protein
MKDWRVCLSAVATPLSQLMSMVVWKSRYGFPSYMKWNSKQWQILLVIWLKTPPLISLIPNASPPGDAHQFCRLFTRFPLENQGWKKHNNWWDQWVNVETLKLNPFFLDWICHFMAFLPYSSRRRWRSRCIATTQILFLVMAGDKQSCVHMS